MRERRLGSLMRRERWDYAELFSVTLLLIWWSAMLRTMWTLFVVMQPGDLDLGWLHPPAGTPSILASLATVTIALLATTAACFLDSRNRTRMGLAIGAFNLAFGLALGGAILIHGSFEHETSAHRASGSPTEFNLSRALAGDWEVVGRLEPEGAPRFPARGVRLTFRGTSPRIALQDSTHDLVDAWASLRSTVAFAPRTPMFEMLASIGGAGEDSMELKLPLVPVDLGSAWLEIGLEHKPELREMPRSPYSVWIAELSDTRGERLEFRLRRTDRGDTTVPDARIWLQKVRGHETGLDLADGLPGAPAVWR